MLGNIGWTELILIFLVILVLFGAKRLPEIGKALGRAFREFKQGMREISEGEKEDEDKDEKKGVS